MDLKALALDYHAKPTPGKVEVISRKPCATQRDLSLAYTPGVAEPCLAIQADPEKAYEYTSRGNLVAVISNGTAVLGLGNIGALAGKPVMEGKGVLFKRFAGIDVFDLEVDETDPDAFIECVKRLEPTFGGINLEDIKAPECFYIEQRLQEMMDIPIFHDDQHGTAIISGAALINGCLLQGKKLEDVRVVMCGAGAAGIACAKFYLALGVRLENLMLVDTKGVIYKGRTAGMNPFKQEFAIETSARTLADAMKGADVFSGVSQANLVTPEMVKSMAPKPVIFAMANPTPEISPDVAKAARPDAIVATGRSDYSNQVNNVLGFPFIFRGALDVRARKINEPMKLAACNALATLAREDVPDSVLRAYGLKKLQFGPDYIIPKPFDPRVLTWESSAVAQAAVESGVARLPLPDIVAYKEKLEASQSRSQQFMSQIRHRARGSRKRIIFADGEHPAIIRAVNRLQEEEFAKPVLVGDPQRIRERADEFGVDLADVEILHPKRYAEREQLAKFFYERRQRKGVTWADAWYYSSRPDWFAGLMLETGRVDGMICGVRRSYPYVAQAVLQTVSLRPGVTRAAGLYIILTKDDVYFLADGTAQVDPTAEQLAEIAILTAGVARYFHVAPRVAMLSFSNFGSAPCPQTQKVKQAVELIRMRDPSLCVDGEMQADTAVNVGIQERNFPFCELKGRANVLIFPDLGSANVSAKLVRWVGATEGIGPLTLGFDKPLNILHPASDVEDVVNAAAITVIECLDGTL
jgi:malate dehydrogenase (oxaloacetate-decarboxylating)(NADP+)